MTVIDWDKGEILNYLGTYFPRSYVESRNIATKQILTAFSEQTALSILDFGCGTGGELIGLLTNIDAYLPSVESVQIVALDGNHHALRLFEKVLDEFRKNTRLKITNRIAPITIDDSFDLTVLDEIITGSFDIFVSFKAICEFVTKDQFEGHNPYKTIVKTYLPRLNDNGLMILVDVTTYSNVSNEWLPNMMDRGIKGNGGTIVSRNEGYNQSFFLKHQGTRGATDVTKVCWRIIKKA
ncbi:MAG: class I SAM-dependent methyltransferase [Bacteroidales bacterium]|nr:class I SAM-dependent methyltransferase [Bacteroidales bacterium]